MLKRVVVVVAVLCASPPPAVAWRPPGVRLVRRLVPAGALAVALCCATVAAAAQDEEDDPLGLLEDVARVVEREFFDPSLNSRADWLAAKKAARQAVLDDSLGRDAATELLKSTGDAFTRLVDATEARNLVETYTTGKRSSLGGLRLARDGTVLAAPANSLLKEGDVVLTVDGQSLSFGALDGAPGTTVDLGLRDRHVRLTRGDPRPLVTSTTSKALLRIDSFSTGTADALLPVVTNKEVVIDLRGNGGGSVEGAIEAAALFLDRGTPIATVKTRTGDGVRREPKVAEKVGPFFATKVTILVDRGTASAAELFTAALAENGRASVVGCCADRTYGKARIQRAEPLPGGDLLLVSRALYETPVLHRDLTGTGVVPDVTLLLDDDSGCCLSQRKRGASSSSAPPSEEEAVNDQCLPRITAATQQQQQR